MTDGTTAQGAGSARPPAAPLIEVDTNAAAVAVGVKPGTIRQWANRGRIARRGRDHRGRVLYDLQQVMEAAQPV